MFPEGQSGLNNSIFTMIHGYRTYLRGKKCKKLVFAKYPPKSRIRVLNFIVLKGSYPKYSTTVFARVILILKVCTNYLPHLAQGV